jgi:hypothetical protein
MLIGSSDSQGQHDNREAARMNDQSLASAQMALSLFPHPNSHESLVYEQ